VFASTLPCVVACRRASMMASYRAEVITFKSVRVLAFKHVCL
jgi:hypothetical protein